MYTTSGVADDDNPGIPKFFVAIDKKSNTRLAFQVNMSGSVPAYLSVWNARDDKIENIEKATEEFDTKAISAIYNTAINAEEYPLKKLLEGEMSTEASATWLCNQPFSTFLFVASFGADEVAFSPRAHKNISNIFSLKSEVYISSFADRLIEILEKSELDGLEKPILGNETLVIEIVKRLLSKKDSAETIKALISKGLKKKLLVDVIVLLLGHPGYLSWAVAEFSDFIATNLSLCNMVAHTELFAQLFTERLLNKIPIKNLNKLRKDITAKHLWPKITEELNKRKEKSAAVDALTEFNAQISGLSKEQLERLILGAKEKLGKINT